MFLRFSKRNFTVTRNDELGRLAAVAIDWMRQRGQETQWMIEGNPREATDFDFCYPIIPIPEEEEVTIYLKQWTMKVKVS
jgi:xylose isomerase